MVESPSGNGSLEQSSIRTTVSAPEASRARVTGDPQQLHPGPSDTSASQYQHGGSPYDADVKKSKQDRQNVIANPTAGASHSDEGQPASSASAQTSEAHPGSTAVSPHGLKQMPRRVYNSARSILFAHLLNVLLIFVPVGIAVNYAGLNPIIIFSINAVAIIPLAGLLSQATEAVAGRLGDTIGALLNITFGNAVELIIFIALVKNEIAVVQASLVGSILSNLLLILGMCFLFGGLRFREQVYNSTVTQMSACLLSLSVTSLLLPTAFHASFSDVNSSSALQATVSISRGSSVILLLIYILYILFQLKSHAYMYASTPQHVIDEESHPGVLAEILNSSTSSDSSSSSDSDSRTSSSGSTTTAKKLKRRLRRHRRRRSSAATGDRPLVMAKPGTPSDASGSDGMPTLKENSAFSPLSAIMSGDEADEDEQGSYRLRQLPDRGKTAQADSANEQEQRRRKKSPMHHHSKKRTKKERSEKPTSSASSSPLSTKQSQPTLPAPRRNATPQVNFAPPSAATEPPPTLRTPFSIRALSVRPAMQTMLSSTVFSNTDSSSPAPSRNHSARNLAVPYGMRRANSLPDRLHRAGGPVTGSSDANNGNASQIAAVEADAETHEAEPALSRTAAMVLLLISTGLVALCANFLVDSIDYMVAHTSLGEAFIGLIILPIVGNAAEHVTAVTVATKNKMDLAIGVAVGSSIQIALFVTPVIVLLGWILGVNMSLYFSLFETVSLFVSAFIVNFLVLDGRSNYLEGALLVAAYVIIAVAAFFYPDASQQSDFGHEKA